MRGDTAMWVLTKMAMLFFIAALAGILLVFGGLQKSGLCNEEALAISNRVASGLSQVINSPVEDERRIIQLQPALAIGDSRSSRYSLNISRRATPDRPDTNAMVISVSSEVDRACSFGVQVTYNKTWDNPIDKRIYFFSPLPNPPRQFGGPNPPETIVMMPAPLNPAVQGPRTTFIAIVKCTQKTTARKKFIFIQDCTQQNAENCISFTSAQTKDTCGFEVPS